MPTIAARLATFGGYLRKRWRWVLFLAVLSLPPLKALVVDRLIDRRELAKVIADLDANDPAWRFPDIEATRRPIPEDKNSAPIVAKAYRLLPRNWTRPAENLDPNVEMPPPMPPVMLTADRAALLAKDLEARGDALAVARSLRDFPEGRYPLDPSVGFLSMSFAHIGECRPVASLLQCDVLVRVHEGDFEEAEKSLLALWNVGQAIGDEPMMIGALVRVASTANALDAWETSLARGKFPLETLRTWRERFRKEVDEELFLTAFRGERAGIHQTLNEIADGKVSLVGFQAAGEQDWKLHVECFIAWLYVDRAHAWFLKRCGDVLAIRNLPPWERRKTIEELERSFDRECKKDVAIRATVGQIMPAIAKIHGAELRIDARLLCAEAALAAEEFRLKNDRWPKSLDELVSAKILPAVPLDPFDGQPLRFRPTADGLAIHSATKTGDYRGDVWDDPDAVDEGKVDNRIEFRLWNPSSRRQAPK